MSNPLGAHGLTAAHQASLSFTISWSLLKFMSTESVMLSKHLIRCYPHPLFAFNLSQHRVFSNELLLHIRWPKFGNMTPIKWCITLLGLPYQSTTNWMSWEKKNKELVSQLWRPEVWDQEVGRAMLPLKGLEGTGPGLSPSIWCFLSWWQQNFSLHMMSSLCAVLCVQISPFYEDAHDPGFLLTLMTSS